MKLLLVGCLAACTSAAALAGSDGPPSGVGGREVATAAAAARLPTPTLVDALTDWLVTEQGLPRPAERPRVVLVPGRQIGALRHFGVATDLPQDLARIVSGQRETVAAYDPATRTIYLRHDWSGRTAAEMSVLVHELVHHLQASAGRRFACVEASEDEAYAAQERWLRRFGASLEADFGIDAFTRLVSTNCAW
jgi:hypothetical protein